MLVLESGEHRDVRSRTSPKPFQGGHGEEEYLSRSPVSA